ncbi:hypothetical protein ACQ4PT_001902 [Festuca glaucescens]
MEMEGGSGNLMVMAQQSMVRTRSSDMKNPGDRSGESVKVGGGKSAMDHVVMGNDTLQQGGDDDQKDEGGIQQEEAENELGKRFEMTRISPERHLYDEIHRVSGLEFGGKYKRMRNKNTQNAEGGKAAASAWRPEESVKETGRPEEALAEAAKAYSDSEIEKRSEMASARALMREELVFGIPDFPSSNFPQMTPKQQVKITSEKSKEQSKGMSEADTRAQRQYELLCAEEEPLPVEVDIGGDSRTMPPMPDSSTVITALAEAENELGKRLEMMRTSPERHLYDEIQTTLLDVQYELTSKNRKLDKETLQVLKDMSSKLAMLDQGGDDDKKDEEDLHHDPGAKKTVEEEMADEAETFDSHRRLWEYKHGRTCGSFTDIMTATPETLQIISMKLTELAGGLELPFSVYGVVAVRDMVDRNRNILFYLDGSNAQELKQNDPFLHLIGPSRAIVFTDKVWIEIELIVKGCPQDKDLISCARCYTGGYGPGMSTICFKNALCKLELCLEPVKKTTQATILGVHVVKDSGSWPFKYGGIVACSPQPGEFVLNDSGLTRRISPSSSEIVLIHSKDEAMPKGENGHVLLSRQVVSVNLKGRLDVVIKAYSKAGDIAAETRVPFYPKVCNISQKKCLLGDAEVAITVAWSIVATCKTGLWIELANRRRA